MNTQSLSLGMDISEKEYRDIPLPSYSYLADIAKAEILKPGVGGSEVVISGVRNLAIADMDGVMIGTIVDSRITEKKDPDNMIIVNKKPSGKMILIIKAILNLKSMLHNPTDLLSSDNYDSFVDMAEAFKYKKDYKSRLEGILNYSEYIDALDKYQDPFIVSDFIIGCARRSEKALTKEYPFIVNPKDFGLEMYNQVKLQGVVNGQLCKGMMDFVFINHSKKKIIPFDLKTGYAKHEDFHDKCYLGWCYYIQSALYYRLLLIELAKHPSLKDYEVLPFQFMYCGRSDYKPLIYKVDSFQDSQAMNGFNHISTDYPGVNQLIDIYKSNISKRNV